ncbi:MAG TPA: zf-HC2 domain-containing protein [Acidobacteriota bacterium]|nr:zf-HC2 domain-containing protein [Acidobacteriota bacterium]
MSCENVQEQLVAQICGELSAQENEELRIHIESCAACRQAQSEFRSILGLIKQMPQREWDEKLRIKELLRRNQRWRTIVFSKAALWLITLTALITVLSVLPVKWDLSSSEFSIRWGQDRNPEANLAEEVKKVQAQLAAIQQQNDTVRSGSETRIKQMLDQNNLEQQRRYFQTLEMFTNYLQLQHKADVQKIQRDIASTYNRTGQDLERTNELLQYVLRASATGDTTYVGR